MNALVRPCACPGMLRPSASKIAPRAPTLHTPTGNGVNGDGSVKADPIQSGHRKAPVRSPHVVRAR